MKKGKTSDIMFFTKPRTRIGGTFLWQQL